MCSSDDPRSIHSLETIYQALQSRRRRLVIHYLRRTSSGVAEMEAVVDWIVHREAAADAVTVVDPDHAEDVAAALHHVHLPKLQADGVVDYDCRTRVVRYREDDLLERHLELAEELGLE